MQEMTVSQFRCKLAENDTVFFADPEPLRITQGNG